MVEPDQPFEPNLKCHAMSHLEGLGRGLHDGYGIAGDDVLIEQGLTERA